MKGFFLFWCFFMMISINAFCQNTLNLPEFIPPSPDVSAIIKGAALSANPHTGAASTSIPIYGLKVSGFTLPIRLNYTTNGFKPNQDIGRVGSGWNLDAGGVVSRIVYGKPDDGTDNTVPLTVSELQSYSQQALTYLDNISNPGTRADSRPDEFRYTVNGLSGKFFFQRNGSILKLPYNNTKITAATNNKTVNEIYITDENGVKYTFGGSVIEATVNHSNTGGGYLNGNPVIRTAWMLTSITLPNGDWIRLSYILKEIYKKSSTISTIKKNLLTASDGCSNGGAPFSCPVGNTTSETISFTRYNSYVLSNIATSANETVNFTYSSNPDNSLDVRLTEIHISNNYLGRDIKTVNLTYVNKAIFDYSTRYFLTEVSFKNPLQSTNIQKYTLVYDESEPTGSGGSGDGTDHCGFANANGLKSNPKFIQILSDDPDFAAQINVKNPNANFAKVGVLKKITFPTGGSQEFFYEPNLKTYWDSVPVSNYKKIHLEGVGANPSQIYKTYFTPNKAQAAEIYFNMSYFGTPPPPGAGDYNLKTGFVRLTNMSTSAITSWTIYNYKGYVGYSVEGLSTAPLLAGIEYKLELEVRNGSLNSGSVDIVYDDGLLKAWAEQNEELCGVRVRKIVSYDPLSRKELRKFYYYKSLTTPELPSAQKLYFPSYVTASPTDNSCSDQLGYHIVCNARLFSKNSVTALEVNDAAAVTYQYVIEADDSLFANGGIQHKFFSQGAIASAGVLGVPVPDRPLDPYNYKNGFELETKYFNSNKQFIKEVINTYSSDNRINPIQLNNYIVRKRYTPAVVVYPITDAAFIHYSVEQYSLYTIWDHLDQTETKEYDLDGNISMSTIVQYFYDRTDNVNPTRIVTTGSDGITLSTTKKLPNDFSNAPYTTMVTRNILSPVIQEENYKNGTLTTKIVTDYIDWFGNGNVIKPGMVKTQKATGNFLNRIHYYSYDIKGNPTEFSKENGKRISYIWDYQNQSPVAEIQNGSISNGVAYSSFEAENKGGWAYAGSPVTDATSPTGNKVYSLSSGNITYTGTLNGSTGFTATYWAKNGTVLLNSGTGTLLVQKNGWNLYKHTLSSGTIAISGTALIDELRLYPSDAFMKSFTYLPFVGVLSTSDNNSVYNRYEYDGFNRLIRIRDWDRNIIKQAEYKLNDPVPLCVDTNGIWVSTGIYRCAKTNELNNANNGLREREEKNTNNCSATYGFFRYISEGSSPTNCPVQTCTGANKRVINGVCTTGTKSSVISEYQGNMQWKCTFHYTWPDGYTGPEIIAMYTSPCVNSVPAD